jgi:hypothetical protein
MFHIICFNVYTNIYKNKFNKQIINKKSLQQSFLIYKGKTKKNQKSHINISNMKIKNRNICEIILFGGLDGSSQTYCV